MHPATEPQKQPQGQPWPVMMQQQQQHQLQHQRPSPSPNMHQNQPLTPQQQQQPYMMQPTHSTTDVSSGYPSSNSNTQSPGEVRTLWIGDLQYWMDENYIYSCFLHTGEVKKIAVFFCSSSHISFSLFYLFFKFRDLLCLSLIDVVFLFVFEIRLCFALFHLVLFWGASSLYR